MARKVPAIVHRVAQDTDATATQLAGAAGLGYPPTGPPESLVIPLLAGSYRRVSPGVYPASSARRRAARIPPRAPPMRSRPAGGATRQMAPPTGGGCGPPGTGAARPMGAAARPQRGRAAAAATEPPL